MENNEYIIYNFFLGGGGAPREQESEAAPVSLAVTHA